MVEGARLESEYTPKAYRGFESHPLRQLRQTSPGAMDSLVNPAYGRACGPVMKHRTLLWLPVVAFVVLIGLLAGGLFRPADRTVRSAMVGQPLPAFTLSAIVPGKAGLTSADFGKGQPRLLNVFASWCAPCIAEAPILLRLKAAGVAIDGVAIRDTGPALEAFLARNGDPFDRIGSDPDSRAQFALGSSGVPESFVIDGQGRIVHQHIGDIRADDVPAIIAAVKGAQ